MRPRWTHSWRTTTLTDHKHCSYLITKVTKWPPPVTSESKIQHERSGQRKDSAGGGRGTPRGTVQDFNTPASGVHPKALAAFGLFCLVFSEPCGLIAGN